MKTNNYTPQPVDTKDVKLPRELENISRTNGKERP